MNRNLFIILLLISIIFFSCSKKGQPGPQNNNGSSGVKIEIVSGNNQTDTVGYPLANPIKVQVTSTNGSSLAGYGVLFQASGCNADNEQSYNLAADNTGTYVWYLAGDIGNQSLKIVVLDANNKHVDSTTAVSNAIAPAVGGWHLSACTFPFFTITAFCKLSTGRLFATMSGGPTYLRYSDDNGASWNSVKSLGKTHNLESVVSTPADELFVVADDGNYYSADAGQTWTSIASAGFNGIGPISAIAYTPSGKLFVTTQYSGSVYISSDKGKTWLTVPKTAFVTPNSTGYSTDFNSPTEDQAGNLYVLSYESGTIFKSPDGGKTWTYLNFPTYRFTNLFIDKNNWFYTSVNGQPAYGIYVSKDDGTTFTLLSSSTTGFNQEISVQSDGNLYYTIDGTGLYRLNNATAPAKWIWGDIALGFAPYIVTKNNNVIEADGLEGFMRYTNK